MGIKLTPKQKARAAALPGKTIRAVYLHPSDPDTSGLEPATHPVIVFTDGSCLRFIVQETEIGEYGVSLIYPAKRIP